MNRFFLVVILFYLISGTTVAQSEDPEKWITEIKPIHNEFTELYEIFESNKITNKFEQCGIPCLPNKYSTRIKKLRQKLDKLSRENPYREKAYSGIIDLDMLAMEYIHHGHNAEQGYNGVMLHRQRVYDFYNIKLLDKYEYIFDIDELENLGAIEVNEIKEIWNDIVVQNNDNGFSQDEKFWSNQYQPGQGRDTYKIDKESYVVYFQKLWNNEGTKQIGEGGATHIRHSENIFEIPSIKTTQYDILRKIKELTPKDTKLIKVYRPSEVDPRHQTHKIALMLESNEVNKRLGDYKKSSVHDYKKQFFIATYEKFNRDLLTGDKADVATNLKITTDRLLAW